LPVVLLFHRIARALAAGPAIDLLTTGPQRAALGHSTVRRHRANRESTMSSKLAIITILDSGAEPTHPIVLPPPSPGEPSHPIVIPNPDPGDPTHPIVIPPPAEGGVPSHPIVIPPGAPTHPIYVPIVPPTEPTHPIVLPPAGSTPPAPGTPTHPIAPGGERPSTQPVPEIPQFELRWSARLGFVLVPVKAPVAGPKK
jgi:hypothetical protein